MFKFIKIFLLIFGISILIFFKFFKNKNENNLNELLEEIEEKEENYSIQEMAEKIFKNLHQGLLEGNTMLFLPYVSHSFREKHKINELSPKKLLRVISTLEKRISKKFLFRFDCFDIFGNTFVEYCLFIQKNKLILLKEILSPEEFQKISNK